MTCALWLKKASLKFGVQICSCTSVRREVCFKRNFESNAECCFCFAELLMLFENREKMQGLNF